MPSDKRGSVTKKEIETYQIFPVLSKLVCKEIERNRLLNLAANPFKDNKWVTKFIDND